ncbi:MULTISPECIES: cell division protein FtsL [unclassified Inquilinus]|uniref:cell division protein FtsL n=1 Tax=unclassified Inquilinus TaxID=2645927 RepID=UPI003F8DC99F
MIRVGTMIWLGLIGASSAFLFKTSYEVQSLEGELRGLNRSILREQDSIRVMHAEWAFLNQPSRLQALTDQYTKLRPIAPAQMIASASVLPMPQPSLDGEPMAPSASLVAQIDALPSFGPVPVPGHRPGEGGVLLAAAEPMPVQISPIQGAGAPVQPAVAAVPAAPVVAPVQVAALETRPVAAPAPVAAAAPLPVRVVADVPIRPIVAPRRPPAPLEAVAQALTPTRAASSDDPIGALLAGIDGSRSLR